MKQNEKQAAEAMGLRAEWSFIALGVALGKLEQHGESEAASALEEVIVFVRALTRVGLQFPQTLAVALTSVQADNAEGVRVRDRVCEGCGVLSALCRWRFEERSNAGDPVKCCPDCTCDRRDAAGVPVTVEATELGPPPTFPIRVRALQAHERADFKDCIRFCQREPLPTTDAETEQRLQDAHERWPHIMELLGAWGAQP